MTLIWRDFDKYGFGAWPGPFMSRTKEPASENSNSGQISGVVSTRGSARLPEIFGLQQFEWEAKVLSKPLR